MRRQVAVFAVLLAASGAVAWYLFRTEQGIDPTSLGKGRYLVEYRWGRPYKYFRDVDGDGVFEYAALLPGEFAQGVLPIEFWEDPRGRGLYDKHFVMRGLTPVRIELNVDKDGNYEKVLVGEHAKAYYEAWEHSHEYAQGLDDESNATSLKPRAAGQSASVPGQAIPGTDGTDAVSDQPGCVAISGVATTGDDSRWSSYT